MSYQIHCLLLCIPCGSNKVFIIDHVLKWTKASLREHLNDFPNAYDLDLATSGAQKYKFDIVQTSRLWPYDE